MSKLQDSITELETAQKALEKFDTGRQKLLDAVETAKAKVSERIAELQAELNIGKTETKSKTSGKTTTKRGVRKDTFCKLIKKLGEPTKEELKKELLKTKKESQLANLDSLLGEFTTEKDGKIKLNSKGNALAK